MLTPAQQKVKQELEELHVKASIQRKDEKPSPNKRPKKTWFYILGGICAAVIISSLLLLDFTTSTDDEIVSYLKVEQTYNNQSSILFNKVTEQGTGNLQQAIEKQAELLEKVSSLEPPARLSKHKQDLLEVMRQRIDLLTYLAESKNRDTIQINKKLLDLKITQGLAAERLANAFEKEKIKYVQKEDGAIEYWVNTTAYQFNF